MRVARDLRHPIGGGGSKGRENPRRLGFATDNAARGAARHCRRDDGVRDPVIAIDAINSSNAAIRSLTGKKRTSRNHRKLVACDPGTDLHLCRYRLSSHLKLPRDYTLSGDARHVATASASPTPLLSRDAILIMFFNCLLTDKMIAVRTTCNFRIARL
jgi:hypothetical protein